MVPSVSEESLVPFIHLGHIKEKSDSMEKCVGKRQIQLWKNSMEIPTGSARYCANENVQYATRYIGINFKREI